LSPSHHAHVHDQQLIHPFGTSRGIDSVIPTVLLELADGALGEGSPVRYKQQTAPGQLAALESLLAVCDLDAGIERVREQARALAPGNSAARAALDIALHDRLGREAGQPLWKLFGAPSPAGLVTSLTIGLDAPDVMERKALDARDYPILKVKLGRGLEPDREALTRVRVAAPQARLSVDANAGWDLATARAMLPVLADCRVELLEQPLAIGNIDETALLMREAKIPVVVDEDVQDLTSLPALVGKVSGINIKLMKCGGIAEARAMIAFARTHGWQVLLGCMVETGIGIAAASHLAGLADWLDLDGAMLSKNNSVEELPTAHPWLLPQRVAPGLGCQLVR
jgi:L-alanine-DL-glutamate epimerase-like enolase superfamily enzyme